MYFRTNPETPTMGEPTHARACRCERPWLFEPGSCTRCGRHTHGQIRATWRAQARSLQKGETAGTGPRYAARRLELVA